MSRFTLFDWLSSGQPRLHPSRRQERQRRSSAGRYVPRLEVLEGRTVPSTVMNNNDSGSGSLRDAIMNAALGDTIGFSPSLSGQTITVASPLTISQNLRIIGLGANN